MSDTHDLVRRARELGEALAQHPAIRQFQQARQAVQADPAAQDLLKQYMQQAGRIRQLQAGGKPIEVADKHKLRDLEHAMASNDALKQMTRWQTEYLALMNQVQSAMEAPLLAGGGA